MVNCVCDCGAVRIVNGYHLKRGCTQSCGCLKNEKTRARATKHGLAKTATYKVWQSIISRCHNKNGKALKNYSSRGITRCERWDKFENFLADMGERPDGMEIDRINNDGNYEPGNCRWVTRAVNQRNKTNTRLYTIGSETMCAKDWSLRSGVHYATLIYRLNNGCSIERALTKKSNERI